MRWPSRLIEVNLIDANSGDRFISGTVVLWSIPYWACTDPQCLALRELYQLAALDGGHGASYLEDIWGIGRAFDHALDRADEKDQLLSGGLEERRLARRFSHRTHATVEVRHVFVVARDGPLNSYVLTSSKSLKTLI